MAKSAVKCPHQRGFELCSAGVLRRAGGDWDLLSGSLGEKELGSITSLAYTSDCCRKGQKDSAFKLYSVTAAVYRNFICWDRGTTA